MWPVRGARWGAALLMIGLLLLGLVAPLLAGAEGPDYAIPERWALPWACGEGHIVTWEPEGHWAHGKATGIAYDFAMREGTPLFSPLDGMAYFRRDDRPFQTNLGNYVEIVQGDWLVRLAHLRDGQAGDREVRAGELIGYSGHSGAVADHLHLEILVRVAGRWGRPDRDGMRRLFGLAATDLAEGAIITNITCPAQLILDGAVQSRPAEISLGEGAELLVPLRNLGLESLHLSAVQVSLYSPKGDALLAEARGEWTLPGQAMSSVLMQVRPNVAGTWRVGRVTCVEREGTFGFPAAGELQVRPAELRLVGIASRPVLDVGESIVLEAWVENAGSQMFEAEGLVIGGTRPDGVSWLAEASAGLAVPPGQVGGVELRCPILLQQVGLWQARRVGFRRGGHVFYFHDLDRSFQVEGPQLAIQRVVVYPSGRSLNLLLTIVNTGSKAARPDMVEVWGWQQDGDRHFSMTGGMGASLEPGEPALVQVRMPLGRGAAVWRLAEAGYWLDGTYLRLPLPDLPPIATGFPQTATSGAANAPGVRGR